MKANEFVKRFGWDTSKFCLDNCLSPNDKWFMHEGESIYDEDFDDLTRLVASHELVIAWRMPDSWTGDYDGDENGLEGAGMYLDMFGNYELVGDELVRFKQAIADVESCQ